MKKRKHQRKMRKIKEERIARRDFCGVPDPTPYEAVKNMIRSQMEMRTG